MVYFFPYLRVELTTSSKKIQNVSGLKDSRLYYLSCEKMCRQSLQGCCTIPGSRKAVSHLALSSLTVAASQSKMAYSRSRYPIHIGATGRRNAEQPYPFKDLSWQFHALILLNSIGQNLITWPHQATGTWGNTVFFWTDVGSVKIKGPTKKENQKRYWEKASLLQRAFIFVVSHR